jgi:hypothetical protein
MKTAQNCKPNINAEVVADTAFFFSVAQEAYVLFLQLVTNQSER